MKAVIVSAVWCSSCLIMTGRYRDLRKKFPQIEFVDFDYDIDKSAVIEHKVLKVLPVLVLYRDNQEVIRFIGEKSFKEMSTKIEAFIDDK